MGTPDAASGQSRRAHEPATPLLISLLDTSWALKIPARGFVVLKQEIVPETHRAKVTAVNRETGSALSIRIEPVAVPGDAQVYREYYWRLEQQRVPKTQSVRIWQKDAIAFLEYLVDLPDPEGYEQHLHAFLVKDTVWVDVHVSNIDKQASPPGSLEPLLAGLAIQPLDDKSPPSL